MVCLRGYELVGNSALECNLGKWLKLAGECEPSKAVQITSIAYLFLSDVFQRAASFRFCAMDSMQCLPCRTKFFTGRILLSSARRE
jgi:hypothetical protein